MFVYNINGSPAICYKSSPAYSGCGLFTAIGFNRVRILLLLLVVLPQVRALAGAIKINLTKPLPRNYKAVSAAYSHICTLAYLHIRTM